VNVLKKKFGIETEISPKRDILYCGRKVSGSAYRITAKKTYHHCTLLLHSDLATLVNVLQPPQSSSLCQIDTKATQSTRMAVANLGEVNPSLNHESLCTALIEAFLQEYNDGHSSPVIEMTQEDFEKNRQLHEKYNLFISWEWIYGHTPHFAQSLQQSFSWATITLYIECENAIIEKAEVTFDAIPRDSEFQSPQKREELRALLKRSLCGVRYKHDAIQHNLLCDLNSISSHSKEYYVECFRWLLQHIPRTP
jgi:hypothetical protein